ncbi:MAG: hypothetical protein K2Z81_23730, partial [Cyanobacteria bacterium]|nr:hypothetical protein [Cyanobacteriota bacterium]
MALEDTSFGAEQWVRSVSDTNQTSEVDFQDFTKKLSNQLWNDMSLLSNSPGEGLQDNNMLQGFVIFDENEPDEDQTENTEPGSTSNDQPEPPETSNAIQDSSITSNDFQAGANQPAQFLPSPVNANITEEPLNISDEPQPGSTPQDQSGLAPAIATDVGEQPITLDNPSVNVSQGQTLSAPAQNIPTAEAPDTS